MKASLLLLLVPCAVLAACNRADTPEERNRSDTLESPMSSPGTTDTTGESAIGVDQNGNATVNPNTSPSTGVTGPGTGIPGTGTDGTRSGTGTDMGPGTTGGTNTTRPDGGSADDDRRNQ